MHQLITESPESQKRSIASYTIVLLNKLQISEFSQQSPQVRKITIDTLSQVLSSEYATDETKRQLLTFVDSLLRAHVKEVSRDSKKAIVSLLNDLVEGDRLSRGVKGAVKNTIDWWNHPGL